MKTSPCSATKSLRPLALFVLTLTLFPAAVLRGGLAALDVDSGSLNPPFAPATTDYSTPPSPSGHRALFPRLGLPSRQLFVSTPSALWREVLPGPVFAAGFAHSLVIRGNGAVIAWGSNAYGERDVPASAETEIIAVAAGTHHSLALRRDGQVVAWGRDHFGQATVPADASSSVVAIAAGGHQSVALRADGSVVAWGNTSPLPPDSASGIVAIAAGTSHVVALKDDGSVLSWGGGTPTPPETAGEVALIAAAGQRSWARKNDGSVVVWGDGDTALLASPSAEALGAMSFAGTDTANYALTPEGAVIAWGPEASGSGAPPDETRSDVVALAAGEKHLLARKRDGTLVLWGDSALGRLEAPNSALHDLALPARAPFPVTYGESRAQLRVADSGPGSHIPRVPLAAPDSTTVALGADGAAIAWGDLFTSGALPASAAGYVAVAAAQEAVLLLDADGRVTAHGANWASPSLLAVPPAAQSDVVSVVAASTHALALKRDGTVVAWGTTASGALNIPDFNPHDLTGGPTAHSRFTVKALAASRNGSLGASFAVRSDGRLFAWGSSSLVNNIPAAAQTDVVAVAAAGGHAVVLKRDNSVVGWGNNTYGQITPLSFRSPIIAIGAHQDYTAYLLADGSLHVSGGWTGVSAAPAAARSGVVAMACGPSHITVLKQDGSLVSWGQGEPLAQPSNIDVLQPGPVGETYTVSFTRPPPSDRLAQLSFDAGELSPTFGTERFSYQLVVPYGTSTLHPLALPVTPGAMITTHLNGEPAARPSGESLPLRPGDNRLSLTVGPLGPPAPRPNIATQNVGDFAIARDGTLLPLNIPGGPSSDFNTTQRLGAIFANHHSLTYGITTEGRVIAPSIVGPAPENIQPTAPGVTPARAPFVAVAGVSASNRLLLRANGALEFWPTGGVPPAIPSDARTNVIAIAASINPQLALRSDGRVVAWAVQTPQSPLAIPPDITGGVVAIASGYNWGMALRADGRVVTWGHDGVTPPPAPSEAHHDVVAIDACISAAVVLKADGSVISWGTIAGRPVTAPAEVSAGIIRIAVGTDHLLALKKDGTLVKWGHAPAGSPAEIIAPLQPLLFGPEQTYHVHVHRLNPADELAAWRGAHFSAEELADPGLRDTVWGELADPDGDGVVNLLEYATRGDPRVPGPLALLTTLDTSDPEDPTLALVYQRPRNAAYSGFTYQVEWSDTLAPDSWFTTGVVQTVIASSEDFETVQALVPADAPRRFARLKVGMP